MDRNMDDKISGLSDAIRHAVFWIIQAALFGAILFTDGSLVWIPVLVSAGVIVIIVTLLIKADQGILNPTVYMSLALWFFLTAVGWFLVFLLCGNITGLYGWVYAGILFSLPLGLVSASILLSLALIPRKSTVMGKG